MQPLCKHRSLLGSLPDGRHLFAANTGSQGGVHQPRLLPLEDPHGLLGATQTSRVVRKEGSRTKAGGGIEIPREEAGPIGAHLLDPTATHTFHTIQKEQASLPRATQEDAVRPHLPLLRRS